jgi:hypothetical protein
MDDSFGNSKGISRRNALKMAATAGVVTSKSADTKPRA